SRTEPIAYRDEDAFTRLRGIGDKFLTHDGAIHIRTDDSVVRVWGGVAGSALAERGAAGSALAERGAAGSGPAERGAAGSGPAERGAAGAAPAGGGPGEGNPRAPRH